MKIVLSWLLDYLDCRMSDIDVTRLVHLFNTRTAEIENFECIKCDSKKLFIAQVESIDTQKITLNCFEQKGSIQLPFRGDAGISKLFLVIKEVDAIFRWATIVDLGGQGDATNFPAISVNPEMLQDGSWRKMIPEQDYVLDVDNKSINHRPDLWGHYGIAREIAAFSDIKFKSIDTKLASCSTVHADQSGSVDGLSIVINDDACFRFAGLVTSNVQHKDVALWLAVRLIRVGCKCVSGVVDLTNYVMFDIGHPMHVFDADQIQGSAIIVRKAKVKEPLILLDGQSIELNQFDLVIADQHKAMSLAGIMGGKNSGYLANTNRIVLEAAGFAPDVIRKSAQRHKIRTEASMRFEKYLDPMQNVIVIQRFIYLALQEQLIDIKDVKSILSVGKVYKPIECSITHDFIEKRIGMNIKREFIESALQKLNFKVDYVDSEHVYKIIVSTTRTTKDIGIQEDILEEIMRLYGLENIQAQLPNRVSKPFSFSAVEQIETIKNFLAHSMHMHEVRDYLLYDNAFIAQLQIDLGRAIKVRNPSSESWTTLVTSLIPHLLKGVQQNVDCDHVRLFEYNRTWSRGEDTFEEKKSLSGIVFDKKELDFFEIKKELAGLWDLLGIDVKWVKPVDTIPAWYDEYKVACLWVGDRCVGSAGMMSTQWMRNATSGCAFIFEIDGEFLEMLPKKWQTFQSWSKYQAVTYDISLMIPIKVTVDDLKAVILQAHELIKDVELVDFFEKNEWADKRALTFRYHMSSSEKTLTKNDLSEVVSAVEQAVKKYDVEIR